MNRNRMERAMRDFLDAVGDDSLAAEIAATPGRVADAWSGELLSGYQQDPAEILKPLDAGADGGLVMVRDIDFVSVCVHHLLPFVGRAQVAYQPGQRLVGVSKLARLVDCHARRLQIQERLTRRIVTDLMEHLQAEGAACLMEARHLCMAVRGAGKKRSRVVTTAVAGCFEDPQRRQELSRLWAG